MVGLKESIAMCNTKCKPILVSILALFISGACLKAQKDTINVVNYTIEVNLDVASHMLNAIQEIEWTNPSNESVDHMQLHVYYNAFRSNKSTFYNETSDLPEFFKPKDCEWGGTDIISVVTEGGQEIISQCKYINTDTKFTEDKTVFYIPLSNLVPPGGTTKIKMRWKAKIPKAMVRTGYSKDFFFFAQWFPKLGVYEKAGMRYATKGGWNCHEYHSMGEYYSDFGKYKVTMIVPKDFTIASTGNKISEEITGDKKKVVYQEENIIDFAWAASPSIALDVQRWNNKVDIIYAGPTEHFEIRHKFITSVMNGLDYMEKYVGSYPYKTLTIIDPPMYGTFCSGMEYPTLITSLTFRFLPTGFNSTETLTTHEFIHQYFMQMVATNEQEEPWMDEGITTYYEGRILDHYLGEKTSLIDVFGYQIGNGAYNRGEFFASGVCRSGDNTMKSWEFPKGGYGPISYNKSAIWIKTLEGLIGREVLDKAMKTFFDRWKYKHPCANDFINVVNETVKSAHGNKFGQDMNWYFDQTMKSNFLCDYEVSGVTYSKPSPAQGLLSTIDSCIVDKKPGSGNIYTITIKRNEDMVLPVEVKYYYNSGKTEIEHFDGNFNEKVIDKFTQDELVKVELDPFDKIHIDKNSINNTYILGSDSHKALSTSLLVSHRIAEFIDYLTLIF